MKSIVDRLRSEKAESEEIYHKRGAQEGMEWAKSAPYLELDSASKFDLTDENGHYDLQRLFRHKILGDHISESIYSDAAMAPE